jgi:hypothetical protein
MNIMNGISIVYCTMQYNTRVRRAGQQAREEIKSKKKKKKPTSGRPVKLSFLREIRDLDLADSIAASQHRST